MHPHARAHHRRSLLWSSLLVALLCALSACAGGEGPGSGGGGGSSVGAASDRPDQPLPSQRAPKYVALGDSYSSAPFVPVTDVAGGCLRSSANYPSLAAKALGAELDDRSCGAARTADFTRSQYADVPPQLSAVTEETDLVTIGIGGNDEKVFARLIGECPRLRAEDPQGSPCRARMSAGGGDALLAALDRTSGRIRALAARVRTLAPDAQVLLVGYPRIVSADDTCPELPLAAGDYAYAEQVNRALTEAVRRAARASGSTYVDVWSASAGHDICSDDPWINGARTDRRQAAAYHPFAAEQAAVADLVVAAAS